MELNSNITPYYLSHFYLQWYLLYSKQTLALWQASEESPCFRSFIMIQVKQYKYHVFCLDPFHYLSRCSISKFSFKDNATHKLNFLLQL